jgi:cation:H+ antiporter
MDSLSVAVPVFLGTALVVVLAGIALARYGDEIAESTGWGALWVGTVLVSIATSLPELVTNISAVLIDAPGLALGNVFGADMINIFTIAMVALLFGVRNLFGDQPKDTQILVLVSVVLGVLALGIGLWGDLQVGPTSVGGLVLIAVYFYGMKRVYDAGRNSSSPTDAPVVADQFPAKKAWVAWVGFLVAAGAIIAAAPFLANSADAIAEISGLGASFMGVLAVSIVTTLPEASVTITAAVRRSYGLVIGNIYGSCAFNLTIIFYADLFHGDGPLLGQMQPEHFVAAGSAIGLMSLGYLIIRSFKDKALAPARHLALLVPVIYVGSLLWVFNLSAAA